MLIAHPRDALFLKLFFIGAIKDDQTVKNGHLYEFFNLA